MRATILIATRNRAEQLRYTLTSLQDRAYDDVEIVVVDDDSDDNTQAVLASHKDMVRSHWMARVERRAGYRRNPSRVLNLGHSLAASDVVIEQGGEVCHLTDCVTPLVAACRPGVVALARVHNGTPEDMGRVIKEIAQGAYKFPMDVEPDTYQTNGDRWRVPIVGNSKTQLYCGVERQAPFIFLGAIHREDFSAVSGYDESIKVNNDGDMADRLIARGVRFQFIGNAVGFHLKHDKS